MGLLQAGDLMHDYHQLKDHPFPFVNENPFLPIRCCVSRFSAKEISFFFFSCFMGNADFMATPEHNYEQLRFNIFFALKSLEKEVSF